MVQIVREYGLIPVPVDIELATTAPTIEDVKAVLSPKVNLDQLQTKLILLSYIYGIIYPIDDIVKLCKEKEIIIVEDTAESYCGNEYIGHPQAIATLFSFGSIKRDTSFGGALAFVRDPEIYRQMVQIHDKFEVQPKKEFFKKLIKSMTAALLLNNQKANYGIKAFSNLINFDYKEFVVHSIRGFNSKANYLGKFNLKPSVALLAFLYDRLKNFDPIKFEATVKKLNVTRYIMILGSKK